MALRVARQIFVMSGVLIFLATPCAIYSCGPFLTSAIFAFEDRPGDAQDFAAGKLGIIRPGFRRSYLVVAYRYLAGLKLTEAQQKAAIAVWNRDVVPEHPSEEEAAAGWIKARNSAPNLLPAQEISPYADVSSDQPYFKFVNCPGDSFQTATRTLGERSAKFGPASEVLREWVTAQDQVFANCGGGGKAIPADLRAGDSLQRTDRAYQIAAAHFYARDFDAAVAEFDSIATDHNSPWSKYGDYLAARALIRKATLTPAPNQPFDRAPMVEAQKRLAKIVAGSPAGPMHDDAVKLLNFVLFRTEPQKRVAELERAMLQADAGANFKQDLWDYTLLLSQGEQSGDSSDWVQTFTALHGFPYTEPGGAVQPAAEETAKRALDRWRDTKSLPWLIAALAANSGSSELLAAANAVPRSSAGYLTMRYFALRSMLGSGQIEPARKELDGLLQDKDIPLGSHNLLNDERQKITTSLNDFLAHASEVPVPSELDFNTGDATPADTDEGKPAEPLFNRYPAEVFLKRMPLAMLVESAKGPALPPHLRRDLGRSAWVRAILLNDLETAQNLQGVLQEVDRPLWNSMEGFRTAASADAKHFAAVAVILSNPGLKPSVRESSFRTATLGEIDEYRDNWWCASMEGGPNWGQVHAGYDQDRGMDRDPNFPFPAWMSEPEKQAAAAQWKKLAGIGPAPNYLAQQVLAYAKEHPQDDRIPEALHLVVRSTRFGCATSATTALSKAAFSFLHEHYPQSEWATKTKYYY